MSVTTKDNVGILLKAPLEKLVSKADRIRKYYMGARLELCSILNARSGLCSEDCKFCAQSAKHNSDVSTYPLKGKAQIVEAAKNAKAIGAEKYGIVTSGNRLTSREINVVAQAISQIEDEVGIDVCCSLGAIEKSQLKFLKHINIHI